MSWSRVILNVIKRTKRITSKKIKERKQATGHSTVIGDNSGLRSRGFDFGVG